MRQKQRTLCAAMLTLAATCATPALAAEGGNMTMEEMAARLERLERSQQNERDALQDKVKISGFMTYGMTRHNVHQNEAGGAPVDYIDRTTVELSHQELSRAGVQINASLSDKTNAVVQILARGRDNYDAQAQWAYLEHEFTPSVRVRGGRMVLPFFMHTQYSNVGYAYHWAALPGEAYDIVPFDTMDGMDLTMDFSTGDISHSVNVFGSAMNVPSFSLPVPVTYVVNDMMGMNLTSNWSSVTTWLSYSHAKVTLDLSGLGPVATGLSLDKANTYIASAGMQYDNGNFLLMAERTELGIEGWFPTKWGGYVSAGYRFGKWMPHLTWGVANSHGVTEASEFGPAGSAFAQSNMVRDKSWTLGMRYELDTNIAVKAEVQQFTDFRNDKVDTNGLFSGKPSFPSGINRDDPMVFRFTVDAVF